MGEESSAPVRDLWIRSSGLVPVPVARKGELAKHRHGL